MPIGGRWRERDHPIYPLGFLQVTGVQTTPVTSIVNSIPPGASECWAQCEGGHVRWTADPSTAPSPTSGMILIDSLNAANALGPIDFQKVADAAEAIKNLRFVAIGATAKLDIHFYAKA